MKEYSDVKQKGKWYNKAKKVKKGNLRACTLKNQRGKYKKELIASVLLKISPCASQTSKASTLKSQAECKRPDSTKDIITKSGTCLNVAWGLQHCLGVLLYSLTICSMIAIALRLVQGKKGALGLLYRIYQSLTPQLAMVQ